MTDEGKLYQFRSSRSPRHPAGAKRGEGGEYDPYALDDGLDYDPDKFYTGSRDGDKESISVVANIPRSLNGHIEAIIQGGKIPYYKTKQDFIRDAIYHRMYFIKNHLTDKQIERLLAAVLAQADSERRIREIEEYDSAVNSCDEALAATLRSGHLASFAEAMKKAEDTLGAWPTCNAKERLAAVIDRYQRMAEGE